MSFIRVLPHGFLYMVYVLKILQKYKTNSRGIAKTRGAFEAHIPIFELFVQPGFCPSN